MSRQAERILQMAYMLGAQRGKFTASELAEYFGVDKRTIYRDIQVLEDCEFRIERDPNGGYSIFRDVSWLPMKLTAQERLALTVLPDLAETRGMGQDLGNVRRAYESALAKMLYKLGLNLQDSEVPDRLSQRILLGSVHNEVSTDGSILELYSAIQRQLTVEMEYESYSSQTTTVRLFDPYYIIPRHHSLYAIGYCHTHCDYRTFRVSRMRNVRSIDKPFVIESDFSLDKVLGNLWGIDKSGEHIKAVLAFDKEVYRYVAEQIENWNSVVNSQHLDDGRIVLEVNAHLNPEFLRWILQYGREVEVLGPEILLDAIREHVRDQAKRYFIDNYH